jgi:cytochrome c556
VRISKTNLGRMLGAIALTGMISGVALAAVAPKDAVAQRQANFKKIGGTFKALNDQLRSPAPDKAQIVVLANQLKSLTPGIPTWFPAGSGVEAGVKTAAKAEIWQKPDVFKGHAKALQVETDKLAGIAGGGDIEAIKAQANVVKNKCSACHSDFRQKDS